MGKVMERLKAANKGVLTQIMILSLVSVIVITAVWGLLDQMLSVDSVYQDGLRKYQSSAKILADIQKVHGDLYRMQNSAALNQNTQEVSEFSEQQSPILMEDVELVQKLLKSDLNSEDKKVLLAVQENLLEYQRSALKVLKLAALGTGIAYLAAADERMKNLNQLLSGQMKLSETIASKKVDSSKRSFYIFLVVLILMLAGGVYLSFFLKNSIRNRIYVPVGKVRDALKDIAERNRAQRIDWESEDEIGLLVESANALCAKASGADAVMSDHGPGQFGKSKKSSDKDLDSLVVSSKDAIQKLREIS